MREAGHYKTLTLFQIALLCWLPRDTSAHSSGWASRGLGPPSHAAREKTIIKSTHQIHTRSSKWNSRALDEWA